MRTFLFDRGTADPTASLGLLVLRAGAGLMMLFGHGLAKWNNFSTLLGGKWQSPPLWPFSSLDPKVSLACLILAEVVAAGLLVIGFATRVSAFFFSFAMVVAAFIAHGADGFAKKEMALLYLLAGLVLIITGAGRYSLDHFLHKEKRRRW